MFLPVPHLLLPVKTYVIGDVTAASVATDTCPPTARVARDDAPKRNP